MTKSGIFSSVKYEWKEGRILLVDSHSATRTAMNEHRSVEIGVVCKRMQMNDQYAILYYKYYLLRATPHKDL